MCNKSNANKNNNKEILSTMNISKEILQLSEMPSTQAMQWQTMKTEAASITVATQPREEQQQERRRNAATPRNIINNIHIGNKKVGLVSYLYF